MFCEKKDENVPGQVGVVNSQAEGQCEIESKILCVRSRERGGKFFVDFGVD